MGEGVIPFCAPKSLGLQQFLRGHISCAFHFLVHSAKDDSA